MLQQKHIRTLRLLHNWSILVLIQIWNFCSKSLYEVDISKGWNTFVLNLHTFDTSVCTLCRSQTEKHHLRGAQWPNWERPALSRCLHVLAKATECTDSVLLCRGPGFGLVWFSWHGLVFVTWTFLSHRILETQPTLGGLFNCLTISHRVCALLLWVLKRASSSHCSTD